jgi:hypothetical protein
MQILGQPQGWLMGMTSDYAGMSSDKPGEKPGRRKPKVSQGRIIRLGLVGS